MKKITTSLASLFLCAAVFGQTGMNKHLLQPKKAVSKTPYSVGNVIAPAGAIHTNPSAQATIWSDDFSVPANWTINTPTGSGTAKDWMIGTTGATGAFKLPKIKSTTAANGFATFDSDLNCSASQIADLTNATAISCTGHPYVNLNFQQEYRRFYDSTFVFVSNDNVNWTKYVVNAALAVNASTANPDYQKIDITAVAGNKATVWVRFEFYSPSTLGSAAGCGYSWMIDDVSLTDMPANDIGIDKAFADFGFMGGGFYTQTPITQITPMTFRASISNQGYATQTGNKLSVSINNGASNVYNQMGTPSLKTLAYGTKDTLFDTLVAFTPPSVNATYTCRWNASQTQTENAADTLNNSWVKTFAVTDTVFARDKGTSNGTIGSVNYTNGEADGSMIGNLFLMNAPGTVSSISAFIDTATGIGTTYQFVLLRIDSAGAFNQIATSKTVNVNTKAGLGKWITLGIATPVVTGNYLAAVLATGQIAGTTTTSPIGVMIGQDKTTEQPKSTSFVYTAGATPATWGYISLLPMIRMNILKGPAGINEQSTELALASAFPNPANSTIAISYTLSQVSDVVIEIHDITGKKMDSFKESAASGKRSMNVNLGAYAAGTYFYSVTSNHAKLNGKFVVTK
jgi:hypothetical protein